MSMSNDLYLKLGEYLAREDLLFTKITDVMTDYVTGSLDIWYMDNKGLRTVHEIDDPTDLLEFLVKRD